MPIQFQNKRFSHPDKKRDEQLLKIIRDLQEEIRSSLDPDEARRLNASLSQHLSRAKEPENREQAIRKAVERIDEYPIVRERFSENLDKSTRWYSKPASGDVVSIAGDLFDIEPGILMVCPDDPNHYQRYRRNARQKLSCPHHHHRLIPSSDQEST
ncbi:MAG: hypothetical protein CVU46_09055 [Chloroflexi bacterium HGW-Chloroflexi-8]|jgi:carbonic anhydrase|nr:MAG: hypothetical protein CVU46_09055 [Chloroflexi bacterium HGW-Chloroflexi-8]